MSALKLDDDTRRTELISACFTKSEKDLIVKAALAKGIPPAWLVRRAALDAAGVKQKASAA